eukprot:TRINITY_DN3080_c0_g1_i1.p2 TRINITY_DN3080_c0_g1~~TRINITY_DN3080_c0_g1_i1.p2  ORF type:complete len:137 (+),score=42.85 TRINITY_DN3080_c0_g1_i1:813-1223(+)
MTVFELILEQDSKVEDNAATPTKVYAPVDPKLEPEEARLAAEATQKKAAEEKQQQAKEKHAVAEAAERQRKAALERKTKADAENKHSETASSRPMSFVAMKRHLKSAGVQAALVDDCLGKYELQLLAEKHSVAVSA